QGVCQRFQEVRPALLSPRRQPAEWPTATKVGYRSADSQDKMRGWLCDPFMKRWVLVVGIYLLVALPGWAGQKYDVRGLVLKVDPSRKSILVSCESIPGYMEAMTMPFTVRESAMLKGLQPGTAVDFTLVVNGDASYADNVRSRAFQSLELDPTQARRMRLLEKMAAP